MVVVLHVLSEEVDELVVGILWPHNSVAVNLSLFPPGVFRVTDAADILQVDV